MVEGYFRGLSGVVGFVLALLVLLVPTEAGVLSPNLDLADLHDVKTKMTLELVHLECDH